MKSLLIAALVAAQVTLATQPAIAADFGDERGAVSQRQGAFAGARVRIPLGGAGDRKARAGLTVAPVLHGRQADGRTSLRFGEGVELNLAGRDKPVLALAGRPIGQLVEGRTGPDGRRLGTSTGKGLLIVGGVVLLTLGAVALLLVAQE